jgi:hypothetical protein
MAGTVDDQYFEWLYSQVGAVRNRNPKQSRWNLLRQLFVKEFVWLIANDDNRVEDGRDLRDEFLASAEGIDDPSREWMELGCSMLEMLIALGRRVAFETEESPVDWFWKLIDNMGLLTYTDDKYNNRIAQHVDEVCDRVIYRNYAPDGSGGLFPLHEVHGDQRKVELWYQMSAYLLENSPI